VRQIDAVLHAVDLDLAEAQASGEPIGLGDVPREHVRGQPGIGVVGILEHSLLIGEVDDAQKFRLLRKAKAFLNPINWNEPFGLTVIEAMSAGVPVVAFDRGSMKEIILDGKTGFIVKTVKEMVRAIGKVDTLNRKLIRKYALSHFSSESMTDAYEKVYESVVAKLTKN